MVLVGRRRLACRLRSLAVAAVMTCCAACGGNAHEGSRRPAPASASTSRERVEQHLRLPEGSLTDVVTYTDAVVLMSVDRDTEMPPTPGESARGSGLTGRRIRVHVTPVWRRRGGPTLPSSFAYTTVGWFFDHGRRTPASVGDGPRLEVGRDYLVPLARFRPGDWGPLESQAVPVLQGRVDGGGADPQNPLLALVRGGDLRNLASTLDRIPPDPRAAAFMALDPEARLRAVNQTKPAD